MAAKLKRHRRDPVKPRTGLRHYEEFLASCVRLGTKWGELSDERLDHLLWLRSELKMSLERHPDGLAPEQRKRLRALAPLIVKGEPDLSQWAERLGYPRSHWWWHLDKGTVGRKAATGK
ncbi:MAG: hypothetical protein NZT92_08020 [Abditibacteriales bacterium]|nr:hypothetical protein [Abditibacteriales bacterium]MDW8365934.1 hypothetical protein [Abditibacteriales bacterium]